jgi:hypothetical protein
MRAVTRELPSNLLTLGVERHGAFAAEMVKPIAALGALWNPIVGVVGSLPSVGLKIRSKLRCDDSEDDAVFGVIHDLVEAAGDRVVVFVVDAPDDALLPEIVQVAARGGLLEEQRLYCSWGWTTHRKHRKGSVSSIHSLYGRRLNWPRSVRLNGG